MERCHVVSFSFDFRHEAFLSYKPVQGLNLLIFLERFDFVNVNTALSLLLYL